MLHESKRGKKVKIKEVIVVEGKADTTKVKQAVEADTIETNGMEISEKTLQLIRHAQKKRGVIIFTDPDFPGNKIRQTIADSIPNCKHAFLSKKEALPKNAQQSVGIEHASIAAIREALEHVYEPHHEMKTDITRSDLIAFGLIGSKEAKSRREQLGDLLRIGYANAKQLLNRLQMFQITKDELNQAMWNILERGNKDEK